MQAWRALWGRLAALDVCLWAAAAAAHQLVQPASRRLCNLAYCLWVVAQVVLALCLCLRQPQPPSPLLVSIHRQPLACFLLGNVATGVVNLSLPTMHASDAFAVGVLGAYMALVCGAVTRWDRRDSKEG